jgi:hypothetical protein
MRMTARFSHRLSASKYVLARAAALYCGSTGRASGPATMVGSIYLRMHGERWLSGPPAHWTRFGPMR